MQQRIVIVLLGCIIVFAAVVRLYHLSSIPPSPFLDEVSNGYNAYSLLKTGNDEYGRHLPLLLQAYNDFRPALFVYFSIPFVQLFGLTVWVIRLPSVLLHVLATVSLFFLVKEMFLKGTQGPHGTKETKGRVRLSFSKGKHLSAPFVPPVPFVPLISAFLYAISPWSIYSSRFSNEINMSLSFFIFALTLFLYAMRGKDKKAAVSFFLSVIFFVLAFYAYHGIKLFLPIFIFCLAGIFFKDLLQKKKPVIGGVVLGAFMLIPLVIAFMAPGATERLGGVSNKHPELLTLSSQRLVYDKAQHDVIGQIYDNRRVLLSLEFLRNYLRNFDPTWLFLDQGNSSYLVPDFGPFYVFELPLLLLGIYFVLTQKAISGKMKILLFLWIILSPLPAAISSESPHLNRTNTLLPAFTILQAMGLYMLILSIFRLQYRVVRGFFYGVIFVAIGLFFFRFVHSYFVELPYVHAKEFQYGTIQAFNYAKEHEQQYSKVIVSNRDNLLESYMYYLFATHYDPAQYQRQGGTHSAFFTDTHLIGKYDFRDPNLYEPQPSKKKQERILYITNPSELSPQIVKNEQLVPLEKIQFPNGSDAVWILEGRI